MNNYGSNIFLRLIYLKLSILMDFIKVEENNYIEKIQVFYLLNRFN
ncbi:hypothetical protein RIEPE_0104 [Candidatus Riesia pediculicola USDA]|uniref:Uncharacterized protein n=1 Tax=Riesia pediculicola (strain USDA) TaxID=515618 RepID=D4G7R5_RIEPU|nr:hypothetical protein RIEPE_0104 [Candidatus Riesia pediculicola USDA]